jgi:hypothetical protein
MSIWLAVVLTVLAIAMIGEGHSLIVRRGVPVEIAWTIAIILCVAIVNAVATIVMNIGARLTRLATGFCLAFTAALAAALGVSTMYKYGLVADGMLLAAGTILVIWGLRSPRHRTMACVAVLLVGTLGTALLISHSLGVVAKYETERMGGAKVIKGLK